MARSLVTRVWNAVKPPPAPLPRRRFNRSQRRLLRGTSIAVALGAGTWGVYAYISSAPDRAQSHYAEGTRLLEQGDFQSAAAQFTKTIGITPESADAFLGRGNAEQAAGQTEAALADFEKALAIDPILWPAYIARGMIRRSRGDNENALTDFTKSIHLHPTAKAYYQRGVIYQGLHQQKIALDNYNLAIDQDPNAPYVYLARAEAKKDLGDVAGAREDQATASRLEQTR